MLTKLALRFAVFLVVFAAVLFPGGLYKGINTVSFGNFPMFDNDFGSGKITGNITLESNAPDRSGIVVVIENTNLSAATDTNGHFEIRNVPVRKYLTVFAINTNPAPLTSEGVSFQGISGVDVGRYAVYIPKPGETTVVNSFLVP